MVNVKLIEKSPHTLKLLSFPASLIPARVHSKVIAAFLNQVFSEALSDDEVSFLQGSTVKIYVQDLHLTFYISLQGKRLKAGNTKLSPALTISGNLHEFLQLAARIEDADTLFFQRRLRMEGDTELGLALKNFLDGLDIDSYWLAKQVTRLARKTLPLYERLVT